jgi:hypothetical protein
MTEMAQLAPPPAGPSRTPHRALACRVVVATMVLIAVLFVALAVHNPSPAHQIVFLSLEFVAIAAALVAVLALRGTALAGRALTLVVLGGGLALQLAAISAPPATSSDSYRYAWDGKVQLAGIDPYRYVPSDPALNGLRDDRLFPSDVAHCAGEKFDGDTQCTRLNRVTVRTIYPPVAEAVFTAMRLASFGGHGGQLPIQLGGLLGAVGIAWLMLRRAGPQRTASDSVLAALWSWSPVVAIECTNNAHIDWLSSALIVLTFGALGRERVRTAAILLGLAIAVKVYPALLLPALLRRRAGWMLSIPFLVAAATYIPHVLAVGWDVVGYLPGYLNEEGYRSGSRFALLGIVMPASWTTKAAALILAAAVIWTLWRVRRTSNPVRPEAAATALVGIAMLVAASNYPWYMLMLLVLICLSGLWQWLPIVLAPSATYLLGNYRAPWPDRSVYLAAIAVTAVLFSASWMRARRRGRAATAVG